MKLKAILILAIPALILSACDSSHRDYWNRGAALLEKEGLNVELLPNEAPVDYYSACQDSESEAAELLRSIRMQQRGARYLIKSGYPAKKIGYLNGGQLLHAARIGASGSASKMKTFIYGLP